MRAGVDARIVGHHHAAHAADTADAGDQPPPGTEARRVVACPAVSRPACTVRATARPGRAAAPRARAAATGRACRTRGSDCAPMAALSARASSARKLRDQRQHRARGSLRAALVLRRVEPGLRACRHRLARLQRPWASGTRAMKAVERPASLPPCPTVGQMRLALRRARRRRAAGAGDERGRRRRAGTRSPPRPRSRCRGAAAGTVLRRLADQLGPSRAGSGPCRCEAIQPGATAFTRTPAPTRAPRSR